jgi:sugar lactone lactonase YvrE
MYFIDCATNGVDVFDYGPDAGSLHNRRRLIDVTSELGMPDSMTVDAEGFLWVALWGGWSVRPRPRDRAARQPDHKLSFRGKGPSEFYVTSVLRHLRNLRTAGG